MQQNIKQLLENQQFMSTQIINLAASMPASNTPTSTAVLTPTLTPIEPTSPRAVTGEKRKLDETLTLTTEFNTEADNILNDLLSFDNL
ncbi:UNVERIFIED_CONTAM: hypothetical protein HDU68_001035 [Siphonaria sp. JEL0065]|nr:hypothetical protein HDU68_001035 [Siphonaria sp. JEL0065]